MHLADFSFSTLCQDVILFQHSVGLERKQLGLFGAASLTYIRFSLGYHMHQSKYSQKI